MLNLQLTQSGLLHHHHFCSLFYLIISVFLTAQRIFSNDLFNKSGWEKNSLYLNKNTVIIDYANMHFSDQITCYKCYKITCYKEDGNEDTVFLYR